MPCFPIFKKICPEHYFPNACLVFLFLKIQTHIPYPVSSPENTLFRSNILWDIKTECAELL